MCAQRCLPGHPISAATANWCEHGQGEAIRQAVHLALLFLPPFTHEFIYTISELESPGALFNLCCNFLIVPGNAIGNEKSMQRILARVR